MPDKHGKQGKDYGPARRSPTSGRAGTQPHAKGDGGKPHTTKPNAAGRGGGPPEPPEHGGKGGDSK